MKPILLVFAAIAALYASAQTMEIRTPNNVLGLKTPDGTPIPSANPQYDQFARADSTPIALLINHQASIEYLLKVKQNCKRMGLYLSYRTLVLDQGQRLTGIEIEYALQHGNVALAAADNLKDSTRFGVFGSVTPGSYRYYVGYERK